MGIRYSADNLLVIGKDRVKVHGKFSPQGVTQLTAANQFGIGATVTRNGAAGSYLITFASMWPKLVSCNASARSAAGTPTLCTFGVYTADNGSGQATLQLFVSQAGTNVDMAANADNEVDWECTFANTASNY